MYGFERPAAEPADASPIAANQPAGRDGDRKGGRRNALLALGAAWTGAAVPAILRPGRAMAQGGNWPTRPLRVVVPFAPGGSSDVIGRLIGKPLGDALGVSVVVENRPGAAGNAGAALVASATDGHTVLLSDIGSLVISPLMLPNLSYKEGDLRGVTMLAYSPYLLAVNPQVPANSLAELVAYSKTTPLNVASSGAGSPNHLGCVEIAEATGMRWQHVPYKGGAQAIADTAAGATQLVLNGMLATMPLVQSGKLRAIGISRRTRSPLMPELATIAEQGMPDFEAGTYQGVVAPKAMPRAHVDKLAKALVTVVRAPDIRARLAEAGAEVMTSSPPELDGFMANERKRWSSLIQRAGARLDGNI